MFGAAGIKAVGAFADLIVVQAGLSVFITGCLGRVGRIATQMAVAGSCRRDHREDAERLGVSPVVDFDFDPQRYRAGTTSSSTPPALEDEFSDGSVTGQRWMVRRTTQLWHHTGTTGQSAYQVSAYSLR